MKKGIIWLVVSGLMVLSLVLASCAPKVTEEKQVVPTEKKAVTEEKKVVPEEKKVVEEKKTVTGKALPQYGGVLNLVQPSDPAAGFTNTGMTVYNRANHWHLNIVLEELVTKDRTKGPAGTGEWSGLHGVHPPLEQLIPALAESWQIIEPDTLKFKIRKGIHWQDKAPTNGAELTAEDVVYTFRLKWARPGSPALTTYPVISNLKNPAESVYLDPDDSRVAVLRSAPGKLGDLWEVVANFHNIYPKAMGAIEGEGFGTWKGVTGTGPFIITDVVMGSTYTYARNPNYWRNDQLHPENRLPYLDGVKVSIIADLSTRYAALRTGKIDTARDVSLEDWEGIMKTNPELQWVEYTLSSARALHMRHDTTPFADVRVRRAMHMAINYDEMIKDFYGGKAEKFWYPAFPIPEHKLAYVPLEQMPKEVQELYSYKPDKAKQLLAEAGFPRGFTTSIIVSSALEEDIDLASVVAAYWAKVGVTLKIDIKEPAVYNSMSVAKTYTDGAMQSIATPETVKLYWSVVGSASNYARVNEPLVEETFQALRRNALNWPELTRIVRETTPALQMLALQIKLPLPTKYVLWQPWLKGYYGEDHPDYYATGGAFSKYVWIDQDLKQKLTGRR
ncbi:MAG: ABC transporter substrate-binding protein [Chloroflexi bacterium]|nr:ABC transporter substrate-binding protein [Chloroflexota bacterium]